MRTMMFNTCKLLRNKFFFWGGGGGGGGGLYMCVVNVLPRAAVILGCIRSGVRNAITCIVC